MRVSRVHFIPVQNVEISLAFCTPNELHKFLRVKYELKKMSSQNYHTRT